ncbi:fen-1 [Microplitis demolitor]|nr:fen-1 [Microplitis demolitor]
MVKSILDLINSDKKNIKIDNNLHIKIINKINSAMIDLTEANINKCICYFVLLLGYIKKGSDEILFEWPRLNENFILKEYYRLLMWMIDYSNVGRNVRDYNNKVIDSTDKIEKFVYLTEIMQNSFKYLSMDIANMKSYDDFERMINDLFISEIDETLPEDILFDIVIK